MDSSGGGAAHCIHREGKGAREWADDGSARGRGRGGGGEDGERKGS
jgi:hypothetical protein